MTTQPYVRPRPVVRGASYFALSMVAAAVLAVSLAPGNAAAVGALPQATPAPPATGTGSQQVVDLGPQVVARCVAETPNGDTWVVNAQGPFTLIEVSPAHKLIAYPIPVTRLNASSTSCLVVGPDGNLWLEDPSATTATQTTPVDLMLRFNVTSHRWTIYPLPNPDGSPSLMSPGPAGIWFVENATHQLTLITIKGQVRSFPFAGITATGPILAEPDGDVWFDGTNTKGEQLFEMSSSGALITQVTGATGVIVLATGPDGQLWVSENAGLAEITPASTVKVIFGTATGPQAMVLGPDNQMWYVSAWFGCLASQFGVVHADGTAAIYAQPGCASWISKGPHGNVMLTSATADLYVVDTGASGAAGASTTSSAITDFATPSKAFADPARAVVNASITLVAMLALTFPSQLFNRTFEENYDEIVVLARRRFGWIARAKARVQESPRRNVAAFSFVVLAGSLLGSLRDPNFGFNGSSEEAFFATLLSLLATTAVGYAVARTFRARRKLALNAKLHALPAGLVVAALCVIVSRIANFQPGYLYGVISGVAFGSTLTRRNEAQLTALATAAGIAFSVLAWLVWVPVHHSAGQNGAFAGAGLIDDFLASVFVGGLTGVVISLLPLRFMPGYTLFNWRRSVWASILGVSAFLLVEVLLRPAAGTSHPGHVAWITAAALFVVFGLGSVLFREYFDRHVPEDKGKLGLGASVVRALATTDGLSERELATSLGVDEHAVELAVARLERARWLARTKNASSEQADLPLHLTSAARAVMSDSISTVPGVRRRRLIWGLTVADRTALTEKLHSGTTQQTEAQQTAQQADAQQADAQQVDAQQVDAQQ